MSKALPKAKELSLKYVISYFAYLFITWGFYRLFSPFPEAIEEGIIKPIVWLLPIFSIILQKERNNLASLGITFKNLFSSVYLSLGIGAVFVIEAMLINFFKYGQINFNKDLEGKNLFPLLGLSFVTAVSEEIAFRGFIYNRLENATKSEFVANIVASCLWTLIHLPITIFILKLDAISALIYLSLILIFGIGASFVFARTKNIFSSIFLHVLWQWPIILFR